MCETMSEIKLYLGDCLQVLKTIPDQSVHCVITSPPYYGLRDYGTAKWEGGDPTCTHRRETKKSEKTITGHKNFDQMLGVGDAIQKDICKYCGAIRIDSQIGLEQTPQEYVDKLITVFRECWRVLRDDGTLWLNLGDSYAGSGKGRNADGTAGGAGIINKGNMGTQVGALYKVNKIDGLKQKDLIGIPWMVAFALRADGWYLRSDIIWAKPNPMPESVNDRPTKSHEYLFLLSKSNRYYYDWRAVLEPAVYDGRNDTRYKGSRKNYDGVLPGMKHRSFAQDGHERCPNRMPPIGGTKHVGNNGNQTYSGNRPEYLKIRGYKEKANLDSNSQHHGNDINPTRKMRSEPTAGGAGTGFANQSGGFNRDTGEWLGAETDDGIPARNKRDVWCIPTKPYKEAHFATYPEDLIEPCVLAGSPQGGTILDPFNGAGTTGVVSLKNNRNYIGIELNPEYIKLTEKRLNGLQQKLPIMEQPCNH